MLIKMHLQESMSELWSIFCCLKGQFVCKTLEEIVDLNVIFATLQEKVHFFSDTITTILIQKPIHTYTARTSQLVSYFLIKTQHLTCLQLSFATLRKFPQKKAWYFKAKLVTWITKIINFEHLSPSLWAQCRNALHSPQITCQSSSVGGTVLSFYIHFLSFFWLCFLCYS